MIYISGAISGINNYMERFSATEKRLTDEGKKAINPAAINGDFSSKYGVELDYEAYIQLDILLLSLCDEIYMLNGFETSPGAMREREFAHNHGIKIIYECGALRRGQKVIDRRTGFTWTIQQDVTKGMVALVRMQQEILIGEWNFWECFSLAPIKDVQKGNNETDII